MTPARTPSTARLARWLGGRRWYAGTDEPTVTGTERVRLTGNLDAMVVTTAAGDRYHLLQTDAQPDRADQPAAAGALASFVAAASTAGGEGATVHAHWIGGAVGAAGARPLGAEQSNTSVTVGGTHLVKVIRRLQPGPHPEVEVGRHLAGSGAPVPALAGWWEWIAPDGTGEVLGTVHELVPGALDGWGLTLAALAAEPEAHLVRLRELGVALAAVHDALARPGDGFGTLPPDGHQLWALADRILEDPLLPDAGHHLVARAVAAIADDVGPTIRTHGDLHLGQALHSAQGWQIIDFEGEPDRPLAQRRAHASPLRDVAGMLRSLHYAAATADRATGEPPDGTGAPGRSRPGWLAAARAAFLDGYLATVDPNLLPASAVATRELLRLFELEKVLYEVRYEQGHRPDWAAIPLAGLHRLVGDDAPGDGGR